ncbi:hypothetical protein [Mangrovicoccus algicola]|uniref:Uncharacterized protein n=1 Tax=Mangrovicoccus algicola TaxID=2771008 RepID=A0A8J6YX18_9RHOB|nr:hypothetical protein [Mangrovicoccus algicola]MBE3639172.1 hypothetical protein [Mangrovicoccus algicola]
MADPTNGLVPEHLPFFITGPGQTDTLFAIIAIFVVVAVLGIGVFYLNLHSIPDRMAHKANHTQLQLIGILTLIALLTHNNIFWVIAIVIAAINPPDVVSPLNSMARSLRRLSGEPADPAPAKETPPHV